MAEKNTGGKMNSLIVQENEQLAGLEKSKAAQIKAVFQPMVEMLEGFEGAYKEVMALEISPDKCKEAKKLRIAVSKIRTNADKARKLQKEEYLRAGNAIQGVYNILKFAVIDKEEKLKEVETHFERIEAEKKAQLQLDRALELAKYDQDGEFVDLGNMPDEVWKNYLAGVKNNYEAVKEAERKAEVERIEAEKKEAEEREAMRVENARLKIEAEKAEKKRLAEQKKQEEALKKEREAVEAERVKQENKRLADQKKADDKLKAEREKAEAEKRIQDEVIRKEREAREKLERDAREKEAEQKRESVRLLAEQKKQEAAPDKEKLFSVAAKLRNTKTTVKSMVAINALENAALLLENIAGGM